MSLYTQIIVSIEEYIKIQDGRMMKILAKNDLLKRRYSIQKEANQIENHYLISASNSIKELISKLNNVMEAEKIEEIKNKPLHGQFFRELDKQGIDKEATMWWLNKTGLKGETESLLVAGQDQVLKTRYYQKHILKFPVSSVCRICHKAEEHINHLIAGCSALAPNEYLERHNKVASYIHWTTCKEYQFAVEDMYYYHTPQNVVKKGDVIILWGIYQ